MTYDLYIGDRTFSSWSYRGWAMLEKFDLPYTSHMVGLYSGSMAHDMAHLAPARTVPALQTPEGHVLTDSIAMAETLAERHPDAGLWPKDPAAHALARSMVAEMHSGFMPMRSECPNMLAHTWDGYVPSDAVLADVERAEGLWALARARHGTETPWLFGEYSLADVFYSVFCHRIATYRLPVSEAGAAYVKAHLACPAFRRWRAMGLTQSYSPMPYALDLPKGSWPGPTPLAAKAVTAGPSENAECPYSGDQVTHFMELDGRIFGFCNAFCRDKTVNDPAAWPAFMALYEG